ncbi:amidohydrolase family protein [Brevibacterium sp. XM4083]|uniref:amidohydrolase family protein n=1 Tax=Brevibacterium sp. XM4083 TaxID=2583238 RepID=UPI0011276966|nr:amidohydrolase family protein [Brevibacterium sp. XM4083]
MTAPPQILDSHLHLWDRRRFSYPWMAELPALPETSLPAGRGATATAAIVVEAGISTDQRADEVDWLTALAAEDPLIRGIVAAVDFTDPHFAEVVARLADRPLVVGVRDNFESRPAGDLDPGPSATARELLRGIETVRSAGLTVDLCVRADQLIELDALLAGRGSAEGFVLDHLGKPLPFDPDFSHEEWAEAMTVLASRSGLHVKFSGLPGQAPDAVDADVALALANSFAGDVITAFGPERTMYGSDHPVSTTGHGLPDHQWEQAAAAGLRRVVDDTDFAAVMAATAADFYLTRRNQ